MTAVYVSSKKLTKYPFKHDPGDEKYYTFVWKPPVWTINTEYLLDSVVRPAVLNGFYYLCVNPGISGAAEPIFPLSSDKTVAETPGNVIWKAVPYGFNLNVNDTISTSIWRATDGVELSNDSELNGITSVKALILDSTLLEFTLTNRVEILRDNNNSEILERSILVSISAL